MSEEMEINYSYLKIASLWYITFSKHQEQTIRNNKKSLVTHYKNLLKKYSNALTNLYQAYQTN